MKFVLCKSDILRARNLDTNLSSLVGPKCVTKILRLLLAQGPG